jgi:2-dehydro-3-deoxygluconokinase
VSDVVTFGEVMAAMRADRPLRLGGTLALSVAGSEGNVAIGLSRLGHSVHWVGRVGTDELGALVLRTLRAEGVTVHATVDPSGPTGALVFERRVADRIRVTYLRAGSAATRMTWDDVDDVLTRCAPRVLHVSGITAALGPGPAEAVHEAVRAAHASGVLVSLDVNFRARLGAPEEWARLLAPVLPMAHLVSGSPGELAMVAPGAGGDLPAAAGTLIDLGVPEVLVLGGASGAAVHTADGAVEQPAVEVPVVDTAGAGDGCVAGYLSGLLDGLPVPDRLVRAVTLGAFAVATEGDWEGLPDRAELGLLQEQAGSIQR